MEENMVSVPLWKYESLTEAVARMKALVGYMRSFEDDRYAKELALLGFAWNERKETKQNG